MDEKKIHTTLPLIFFTIIQKDIKSFNIPLNNFYNRIYSYINNGKYKDNKISVEMQWGKGKDVRFSLNKENKVNFQILFSSGKLITEADYFRTLFSTYAAFPAYEREKVIFAKEIEKIEKAIKDKRKIVINYDGINRVVEPYFIQHSIEESHNYLYCWCYKNSAYRVYRLSKIKSIYENIQKQEKREESNYKMLYDNFDPFLSYGNRVKVRMSNYGFLKYEVISHNRPKLIEKEENIYIFECSEAKAVAYFAQFVNDAEVLEPESVREKLKKMYLEAIKIYGDN